MSSPTATFLVSGATGNQGGSLLRELLKAGYHIHVLVRDPSKPQAKELESLGAVLFVGDYNKADAIREATVGVKGVFINPHPVFTDPNGEAKQVQLFVDAAHAAGTVDTLVISTVAQADKFAERAKAHPEQPLAGVYRSKFAAVRASGIEYWTVLRPPWLFQNLIYPAAHGARRAHPDSPPPARRARRRAQGFADAARSVHGKNLELAALREAVHRLSEAAGCDISVAYVSPEELERDTANPVGVFTASRNSSELAQKCLGSSNQSSDRSCEYPRNCVSNCPSTSSGVCYYFLLVTYLLTRLERQVHQQLVTHAPRCAVCHHCTLNLCQHG